MRDDRARLLDIQEAIERIEQYAARGRAVFEQEPLIQTWIMHHLQIIGEAASRLSDDFRRRHPEIDWGRIIGTRNVLVHHYFGIDTTIVWEVVQADLPDLKVKVAGMLWRLDQQSPGV